VESKERELGVGGGKKKKILRMRGRAVVKQLKKRGFEGENWIEEVGRGARKKSRGVQGKSSRRTEREIKG